MKRIAYVALFYGILLPVLETIRKWGKIGYLPDYLDDWIIGTLLITFALIVIIKNRAYNGLIACWGIASGGFYYSFFSSLQTYTSGGTDVSGHKGPLVLIIKAILFLVAIICLVLSATITRHKEDTH
jgi:hypothetical protein